MDEYERKILTILFSTNKTLYEAQTSNKYRLDNITELNESAQEHMYDISIAPLDMPLQKIRNEIYTRLLFAREYVDFLSNIGYINLYDCAEIIVEIGDIGRFSNRKRFISYAGENLKVALTRCTQKIINHDSGYENFYNKKFDYYQFKHPKYSKKRLHLMALKKTTIKFANEVYAQFKMIKDIEDYEKLKYEEK